MISVFKFIKACLWPNIYDLSWRMFHIYLRRMLILLLVLKCFILSSLPCCLWSVFPYWFSVWIYPLMKVKCWSSLLLLYCKSPTYKPSMCKLSKMWTRIWFQQGSRKCIVNIMHEWNCSFPSVSYCWWFFSSTISHLLPFLLPFLPRRKQEKQDSKWLFSLDSSPCMPDVARYCCTTALFQILDYKI